MNKLTQEQIDEQLTNIIQVIDILDFEKSLSEKLKNELINEYLSEQHSIWFYEHINRGELIREEVENLYQFTTGIIYPIQARLFAIDYFLKIKDIAETSMDDFIYHIKSLSPRKQIKKLKLKLIEFDNLNFFSNQITINIDEVSFIKSFRYFIINQLVKAHKLYIAEIKSKKNNFITIFSKLKSTEKSLVSLEMQKHNKSQVFENFFLVNEIYRTSSVSNSFKVDSIVIFFTSTLFEEFYLAKLKAYLDYYKRREIDFVNKFIWQLKEFINTPTRYVQSKDYSAINLMIREESKHGRPQIIELIEFKKRIIDSFGEEKFLTSIVGKIDYLNAKFSKLKDDILGVSDDSEIQYQHENMFFLKIAELNNEYNYKREFYNLAYLRIIVNRITENFLNEIIENYSSFTSNEKEYYYNKVLKKTDDLSIILLFHHVIGGSDVIQEIKISDLFKDYLDPLESPDKDSFAYIVNVSRLRILQKLSNFSGEMSQHKQEIYKINDVQPKHQGSELYELISESKFNYIKDLLENISITKDGKYILGNRKKSSIFGVVEALQDKSILPSSEKQNLCKLIAKEINLNIASDLEETITSKDFKSKTINYLKGHPI